MRARVEAFVDKMLFTEGTEVKEGESCSSSSTRNPFLEKLAAAKGGWRRRRRRLTNTDGRRPAHAAGREAGDSPAGPRQRLASVDVGEAGVVTAKARVESAQMDLGYCE